jgi:hypothetical protein
MTNDHPAGAPPVLDVATWQATRDSLMAREKAHMREGDAIAAARRRLPMVEATARRRWSVSTAQWRSSTCSTVAQPAVTRPGCVSGPDVCPCAVSGRWRHPTRTPIEMVTLPASHLYLRHGAPCGHRDT